MLTVTKLAGRCGLSRSAVLYYESIGLLRPARRSEGNYRCYTEKEVERLRQICAWRKAGLKLEDIRAILARPGSDAAAVLERRLVEIDGEIEQLRGHQRAIARLLQHKGRLKVINKEKWVAIMKAAKFGEADMRRWHVEFERAAPAEHQEFLEFLHIPAEEILSIREWSRKGEAPAM
jgi:DNA-binding transcriptional MerR regulator